MQNSSVAIQVASYFDQLFLKTIGRLISICKMSQRLSPTAKRLPLGRNFLNQLIIFEPDIPLLTDFKARKFRLVSI